MFDLPPPRISEDTDGALIIAASDDDDDDDDGDDGDDADGEVRFGNGGGAAGGATATVRNRRGRRARPSYVELAQVDVESADFAALPLELQHEMVLDLQEAEKHKSRRGRVVTKMNDVSFSEDQIVGIKKKNMLARKLDQIRKSLLQNHSSDGVVAHKVVSEDRTVYILEKDPDYDREPLAQRPRLVDAAAETEPSSDGVGPTVPATQQLKPSFVSETRAAGRLMRARVASRIANEAGSAGLVPSQAQDLGAVVVAPDPGGEPRLTEAALRALALRRDTAGGGAGTPIGGWADGPLPDDALSDSVTGDTDSSLSFGTRSASPTSSPRSPAIVVGESHAPTLAPDQGHNLAKAVAETGAKDRSLMAETVAELAIEPTSSSVGIGAASVHEQLSVTEIGHVRETAACSRDGQQKYRACTEPQFVDVAAPSQIRKPPAITSSQGPHSVGKSTLRSTVIDVIEDRCNRSDCSSAESDVNLGSMTRASAKSGITIPCITPSASAAGPRSDQSLVPRVGLLTSTNRPSTLDKPEATHGPRQSSDGHVIIDDQPRDPMQFSIAEVRTSATDSSEDEEWAGAVASKPSDPSKTESGSVTDVVMIAEAAAANNFSDTKPSSAALAASSAASAAPDLTACAVPAIQDATQKKIPPVFVPSEVATEAGRAAARDRLVDGETELQANARKAAQASAGVSAEVISDVQQLLVLLGLPFITAPMEAEAQCAALEESGLTAGTITDDSDIFLFGGRTVYRRMCSKTKGAERYTAAEVMSLLRLDRDRLISLGYLLGCDYTAGLGGVGVVTAMDILAAFPGESMLEDFKSWYVALRCVIQTPAKMALPREG